MASIQSLGIGSGIDDVAGIIDKLVSAERAPSAARYDQSEARLQVQLSALGALRSALGEFRTSFADLKSSTTFNSRSVTFSDENQLSASAGTAAVPGQYEIKVTALAQAQKQASEGVVDSSADVGVGTLEITVGGSLHTLSLSEGAASVSAIRDAINEQLGGEGVSASLLHVDDGHGGTHARLVLSSGVTGQEGAMTLAATGDPSLVDFADGFNELVAAQDAVIEIDGLAVTSSSNTLSNVIEGVTLELAAADPDRLSTLSIAEDHSALSESLQRFVDGYNALNELIVANNSYDAATEQGGALLGDAAVRGLRLGLSSIMGAIDRTGGRVASLAALGITTNESGALEFDSTRLDAALSRDPLGVEQFLSDADSGLAKRLDDFVYGYSRFDGVVASRLDGIGERIADIAARRVALDERMARVEKRYTAQFAALDQMMSQLNNTSSFLAQQLKGLNSSE